MSNNTSKISVNYNEIADLAKQLNNKDKMKLAEELKRSIKHQVTPTLKNTKESKEFVKSFLELRGTGSGNLNETLLRDRARDKAKDDALLRDRARDKANE